MPEIPIKPCDSCGAPVVWATTDKGKRMPLEAEPELAGTYELFFDVGIRRTRFVKPEDRPGRYDLRLPHWALCPQAAEWRRKQERPAEPAGKDPAGSEAIQPGASPAAGRGD
jgi:hypothetical protein